MSVTGCYVMAVLEAKGTVFTNYKAAYSRNFAQEQSLESVKRNWEMQMTQWKAGAISYVFDKDDVLSSRSFALQISRILHNQYPKFI